jgi:hypothetical protein
MALETKTLEQLQEIAAILQRVISQHPRTAQLERSELWEVEQWIAERRKEKEVAASTAA